MFKVIGLVGKLQSGKSTAGSMILDYFLDKPSVKTSFANHLKAMIYNAGLCNEEELWGTKTEFSRLMLQKIGTEIIRKQVDPNFWVKKMIEEVNEWKESNKDGIVIVIDDVRFINEAAMIKMYNGILIRIERPILEQNKKENQHLSETEQDTIIVDYTIVNDGNLEKLKKDIDNMMKESGLVN